MAIAQTDLIATALVFREEQMPQCVALLSGGLDSMLAIRLMQEQNVGVEAVTFRTLFTGCHEQAASSAQRLERTAHVLDRATTTICS